MTLIYDTLNGEYAARARARLDVVLAGLPPRDAPDAVWTAHFDTVDPGYTHVGLQRLRRRR